MVRTKDRVEVRYERTINVGNYESVRVGVGYSTDLKKEETVEKAFARADEIATAKLEELCEPIEQSKSKRRK